MEEDRLQIDICALLESNLGLPPHSVPPDSGFRLLGALPELDSASVVSFLISLEEQYGITIHDDEVDASLFETVGTVAQFVRSRLV